MLADLLLYSDKAEVIQSFLHVHERKKVLGVVFNLKFRCIDDNAITNSQSNKK